MLHWTATEYTSSWSMCTSNLMICMSKFLNSVAWVKFVFATGTPIHFHQLLHRNLNKPWSKKIHSKKFMLNWKFMLIWCWVYPNHLKIFKVELLFKQFPVIFLTRCQPCYIYRITHGRPEKSKQLQQSSSISTIANIASY